MCIRDSHSIDKTKFLNHTDFIIRLLYKHSYGALAVVHHPPYFGYIHLHSCKHKTVTLKLTVTLTLTLTDTGGAVLTRRSCCRCIYGGWWTTARAPIRTSHCIVQCLFCFFSSCFYCYNAFVIVFIKRTWWWWHGNSELNYVSQSSSVSTVGIPQCTPSLTFHATV